MTIQSDDTGTGGSPEAGREWNAVGDGTPLGVWLETRRDDEVSTTISLCQMRCIGDDPEWVAPDGRTTVTHSTYLPPTHWRWPLRQQAVSAALAGAEHFGLVDTDDDHPEDRVVDALRERIGDLEMDLHEARSSLGSCQQTVNNLLLERSKAIGGAQ